MRNVSTWRNLRSVMMITLHVAAIAALIRYLNGSRGREMSLVVWVPVTIASAALVSWPMSRLFFQELGDGQGGDRACPRCRRNELRPIVRPGEGIFQVVTTYRCACCGTKVRMVGDSKVIEPEASMIAPTHAWGIRFLDEPATVEEIRFLDEPSK